MPRFDLKCKTCGKDFVGYVSGRKNCSRACYRHKTPRERFMEKVSVNSNGCWMWTSTNQNGYAAMWYEGRTRLVSKISWFLFKGEWPKLFMLHKCDIPMCVNPEHLFDGTALNNMLDKTAKGRNNPPVGERAGQAKLTEEKVLDMRSKYATGNFTQRKLADIFEVGYKAVCKIVHRQRWRHI
jgi:hypothetical protein